MSEFPGYRPPTSNTTWIINQLIEVVMPNSTEGCWRLVAYMSRRHFGWCDEHGNPLEGEFEFSIKKLAQVLCVSEKTVKNAITEALEKKFIHCVRHGQRSTKGDAGCHGIYALRFDSSGKYAKRIEDFEGFYTGDGHRTAVPDQFFDTTIYAEKFPLVKVIGAIFRYTIGFQAEKGYRRQIVQISLRRLQEITGIGGRRHLLAAIRDAVEKGYIKVVGGSSAKESPTPVAAAYQILWSDAWDGSKPSRIEKEVPKEPEEVDQGKKGTSGEPGEKGNQDQGKKGTSPGAEREPENRGKKGTSSLKTNSPNHISKRQQQQLQRGTSDEDLADPAAVALLKEHGIPDPDATIIARGRSYDYIRKHCEGMKQRKVDKNYQGYLRKSIENDWPCPSPTLPNPEEKKLKLTEARNAHKAKYSEEYKSYLESEAERISKEQPDLYASFVKEDEKSPFYQLRKQQGDKRYVEMWQNSRMLRFGEKLHEDKMLMGFWQWDRTMNTSPLEEAC